MSTVALQCNMLVLMVRQVVHQITVERNSSKTLQIEMTPLMNVVSGKLHSA